MVTFTLEKVLSEKNVSRYILSKRTGIDYNTITKICKNEAKQIKLETLNKICMVLECNLWDILEFKKD